MSRILAIDPGNTESGYALINAHTRRPIEVGKIDNHELLADIRGDKAAFDDVEVFAIEMIASYGMAVGKEVFETCVWIGRFDEASTHSAELVYRREVKLHHCHSAKAKDANIAQALIDRFASGEPNRGKGTKAAPGWFYGFRADIWQAYALAVLVADRVDSKAVA
ncbi:MAG: hypothetical protein HOV78_20410 [Hamadaea sp.]|nr:hypothetical protein [Hamadaea sp.]NUO90645.1 hypothetical protein [Dermatophilaceae bacterium]